MGVARISTTLLCLVILLSSLALVPQTAALTQQSAAPQWVLASPMASPTALPSCSPSGLCPSMLLAAYNVEALQSGGITGNGQAIVIVDACNDPSIASDLAAFDSQFGLQNPTLNVVFPQGTPACLGSLQKGWDVEISLDVEWAHVMAPSATINLLLAKSPTTSNLVGAWTFALANHLGNQISNSWGGSGSCTSSMQSALSTANTDHVTVLASAGDSGAWGTGTTQTIQNPADCQRVLTVGGTTLNVDSSGNYLSESAWGASCIAGSGTGGGYVTGVTEPGFQSSVKINDPSGLWAKSDVSAVADPCTGAWVFDTQTYSGWPSAWGVVGGTSLSCPLWAGFMADVNQIRSAHSLTAAGTVTPFLYTKIYGISGTGSGYPSEFHDVISGNNGFPAGPGWDPATGLGSFNVNPLATVLGTAPGA